MGSDAVVGLVGAGVLLWVIYGPWQMVCTDTARCKLFILRDQLFDIAAGGSLSFDSVEYIEIRSALNLMIRYAHRLTILRLATMVLFHRKKPRRAAKEIARLIASIPNEATRHEISLIFIGAMEATFAMACLKSPYFTVLYAAAYVLYKGYQVVAHRSAMSVRAFYQSLRDNSAEVMLSGVFCSDL